MRNHLSHTLKRKKLLDLNNKRTKNSTYILVNSKPALPSKKIEFKAKKIIPTIFKKSTKKLIKPPKPPITKKIPSLLKFKNIVAKLPEVQAKSKVKSRGPVGQIKYLLFLVEPHWVYLKDGIKVSSKWTARATKTVWFSKRGKIIIVQGAVIASLVLALTWQLKPKLPHINQIYAQDNQENVYTIDDAGIRRYLPSAREYVEPKAFEPVAALAEDIPLSAWIAPWNLEEQKPLINTYSSISAFWLTINENGFDTIEKGPIDPLVDAVKDIDREQTSLWLSISGDPDYVYKALIDPEIATKLTDNLLAKVNELNFKGVDIDFEGLGEENRDLFNIFIKQLAEKFHAANKLVSVTLEARIDDPPMDWKTIAENADELRPMFYDYHARNTGFPGPISPVGWISEKMEYAKTIVPKEKLVPALGNYGYDWHKNDDPTALNQYSGIGVSFETAINLASKYQSQIYRARDNDARGFDIGDAPHFSYSDENKAEHHVWFEDKQSLGIKTNLIAKYSPKSIIFWNVGLGDTLQSLIDQKKDAPLINDNYYLETTDQDVNAQISDIDENTNITPE